MCYSPTKVAWALVIGHKPSECVCVRPFVTPAHLGLPLLKLKSA